MSKEEHMAKVEALFTDEELRAIKRIFFGLPWVSGKDTVIVKAVIAKVEAEMKRRGVA
jgi:hypothetical protein